MGNNSQSWSEAQMYSCSHLDAIEFFKLIFDLVLIICTTMFFGGFLDKSVTRTKVVSFLFAHVLFWTNFVWSIVLLADCQKNIESRWNVELTPTKAFYSIAIIEPIMVTGLPVIILLSIIAVTYYCNKQLRQEQEQEQKQERVRANQEQEEQDRLVEMQNIG